jgi:hypothetical protein
MQGLCRELCVRASQSPSNYKEITECVKELINKITSSENGKKNSIALYRYVYLKFILIFLPVKI